MRDLEDIDDIDRTIIQRVIEGRTNRNIAREVGLAEGTVKWRLHRLYRRLGVSSRVQFVTEINRRRNGA